MFLGCRLRLEKVKNITRETHFKTNKGVQIEKDRANMFTNETTKILPAYKSLQSSVLQCSLTQRSKQTVLKVTKMLGDHSLHLLSFYFQPHQQCWEEEDLQISSEDLAYFQISTVHMELIHSITRSKNNNNEDSRSPRKLVRCEQTEELPVVFERDERIFSNTLLPQ